MPFPDLSIKEKRKLTDIQKKILLRMALGDYDVVIANDLPEALDSNTIYLKRENNDVKYTVQLIKESFNSAQILFASLPENIQNNFNQQNAELKNYFINLCIQQKLIEPGLLQLTNGIVTLAEKNRTFRLFCFYLLTVALIYEIGFLLLQISNASSGYESLIHVVEVCSAIGIVASLGDFVTNIWGVSSRKDGDELAFGQTQYSFMTWIFQLTSLFSYMVGGAANGVYVIPYLLPKHFTYGEFISVAIPIGITSTLSGVCYYGAFNDFAFRKFQKTIKELLSAPKSDINVPRIIETFIDTPTVFAFRALSFMALATIDIEGYRLMMSNFALTRCAEAAFFSMVINVLCTRGIYPYLHWQASEFAYLNKEEITVAQRQLSLSTYASLDTFVALSQAIAMSIVAYALTFNRDEEQSSAWWILVVVPSVLRLMNSFFAQTNLMACKKAAETLGSAELDRRKKAMVDALRVDDMAVNNPLNENLLNNPVDLVQDDNMPNNDGVDVESKKAEIAQRAIDVLAIDYIQDDKTYYVCALCCFLSVVARGGSFINFTDILNQLYGIDFDPLLVNGLDVFVLMPNLCNFFVTFFKNMIANVTQKQAETYIWYIKGTQNGDVNPPTLLTWAVKNPKITFYQDYIASTNDMKVEDLTAAVKAKL